jgi:solute carrier family 25 citrate transporter 1
MMLLLHYFMSLSLAGGIECISVWPMEYIKTQLQLQKVVTVGGPKPPYTGMISGLVYTVKTTGFFSLYKGLSVTLVRD